MKQVASISSMKAQAKARPAGATVRAIDKSIAGPAQPHGLSPQHSPAQPLRSPKQQRSRILMQSVREATLELLQSAGPAHLTTVKIAARAGISIGSLYRYYPSKEAVLTDIYDAELAKLDLRLRQHMRPHSGTDPLESLIREGVAVTVAFHRDLLALNSNFYIAFRQNFNITDRQGPTGTGSWDKWTEQWLIEVLRNNQHRLKVTDLPATARLLIDMASGTLHRMVETRPKALNDDIIVTQLTDLICGYLLA